MRQKTTLKEALYISFFIAGALLVLFTSIHYFTTMITGIVEDKEIATEMWYHLTLRVHIAFGMVAIFTGPFQFIKSIRMNNMKFHRRSGYVYATSILISGLAGLVVAQFAMGGIISSLGFSTLALLWLFSIQQSIRAIRKHKIEAHKKWMFISYGLTFAAIPQRFFLALALITDISFIDIYRMSAWFPWIFNTIIALILYNRMVKKEKALGVVKRMGLNN